MNANLMRRIKALGGDTSDQPMRSDIIFLCGLRPEGSHGGPVGGLAAFLPGVRWDAVSSNEGETIEEFEARLRAEYPQIGCQS